MRLGFRVDCYGVEAAAFGWSVFLGRAGLCVFSPWRAWGSLGGEGFWTRAIPDFE
jgi:hypothetical protein